MTTRTITGVINHASGDPWVDAQVKFRLKTPFAAAAGINPLDYYAATTDNTGSLSLTVAVPDTGTATYEIELPDKRVFTCYLAAGPTADLTTLITLANESLSQDGLQTLIDAHMTQANPHPGYALKIMAQTDHLGWAAGGPETAIDLISNSGALQINKEIRVSAATGVVGCFGVRNVDDNSMAFACENYTDTTNRFRIFQNGAMAWGNGTDPVDLALYRDQNSGHLIIFSAVTDHKDLEIYTNQYGAVLQLTTGILYFQAPGGIRISGEDSYLSIYNGANLAIFLHTTIMSYTTGNFGIGVTVNDMTAGGSLAIAQDLSHRGSKAGFFNTTPVTRPTGVEVSAAGIHAALVTLGLIAA